LSENPDKERKFTPQDLAANNGAEGQPVYIAFRGKVYDVSGSDLWEGGQHMGRHKAGADLTEAFNDAPHDDGVFNGFPQVGVIIGEEAAPETSTPPSTAREFWHRQVKRVPFLRRHPHPMVVHFPIVFMISATVFTLLYLFTGIKSFEVTGFHCLGGGVLFTPVAIATGWFTWWLNYESRPLKPVVIKLILSPILLLASSGAFVWRFLNPEILTQVRDWPSLAYLALICCLTPLVSLIGAYGAIITFPLSHE
jgi:predicted heme/steroid binding protein/uncharacterized membrane protein